MITIAFFNNKGGVGKTALVYHLAWMFADQGRSVLAADLDPQANLSTMFLDEQSLEGFWPEGDSTHTVLSPIRPLLEGEGGIESPHVEPIEDLGLLVGDLALSGFEDELSQQWPRCLDGEKRAFRIIGAFAEVIQRAGANREADLALVDVGPNLGAINRAALIAADYVVVPLGPDLFSLKGLQNLGPTLRRWRTDWRKRLQELPTNVQAPSGQMTPIGYVVMQHSVRLDRPVKAYGKWMDRIPSTYHRYVLDKPDAANLRVDDDSECLAALKDYRSLMPMAQEARKPMFHLKPADGAIGSHVRAVQNCYKDFRDLAAAIDSRTQ
ncbi:ParA family protein [Alkalilimnicola ehrlichii MLHE-1]|uniref:Cobyrinic acid a,c-diamide synthase n=1 Tax=Alkalilimnicola ehrlichii (strain ATCC BAA-1101 / DSM 17681 / MLHE-1) TaxID=187272 RepID=Q0A696_ALKEH|nr:AAA family ATPase [Alkalilimnicola ehrlichii]ABI57641.1 Cobyrinic acid a,c-diamide synthase [Alkalilimnicola ehrlichii MLHE-1]